MPTEGRFGRPVHRDRVSAILWAAALFFFVIGDLVTTAIGLSTEVAAEAGPVVRFVIERYGLAATVPLKASAVAVCVGLWRITPDRYARGVPLGMAAVGLLATAWNISILAAAL